MSKPANSNQDRYSTWHKINEYMADQYLRWYTPAELRQMEVKWRRIFAEAGWSVKGE